MANNVCLLIGAAVAWILYSESAGQPEAARLFAAGTWGSIAFVVTRTAWASREGAAHFMRTLLAGCGVGMIAFAVAGSTGVAPGDAAIVGAVAGALGLGLAGPRRRRHLSAKDKRRLIARELGGERYDSKRHHIDHIHPFSRGGSDTLDNLRIIDKRKNLRKGARRPGFFDWFR